MKVRRSELLAAIRGGVCSVDRLREVTGASAGCGTCRVDLETLLTRAGCPRLDR
ncbi:MAG: (2Fe-2S)-binding protein [Planctomycetes bacterium]|nr:(2Fe-2S)-binding protein [Planctomycetota bacterium]